MDGLEEAELTDLIEGVFHPGNTRSCHTVYRIDRYLRWFMSWMKLVNLSAAAQINRYIIKSCKSRRMMAATVRMAARSSALMRLPVVSPGISSDALAKTVPR